MKVTSFFENRATCLGSVFALGTDCLGTQAEGLGCCNCSHLDPVLDSVVDPEEVFRIRSAVAGHQIAAVLHGIAEKMDRSEVVVRQTADRVLRHNLAGAVPGTLRIEGCLDTAGLDAAEPETPDLDTADPGQDSQLGHVDFLQPVSEPPSARQS